MTNQISMLRGPERVRRRPAVIFGSADINGVLAAFEMLLEVLLEESANGFSKQLVITQYRDGSISIRDDGRGIFLGTEDKPLWEDLFCELYAGGIYTFGEKQRSVFEEPSDENTEPGDSMALCAVQYASEYMDVCINRDGQEYRLHFEKGHNKGGLTKTPSTQTSGTDIRFKPDAAVFTQTALPTERLLVKAEAVAMLIPGLKVIFRRESADAFEEIVFHYPTGIEGYLKDQNNGCFVSEFYTAELEAEGQERYNKPRYTATVKLGLCFTKEPGFVRCFHNQKALTCGGPHLEKVLDDIYWYLFTAIGRRIDKEKVLAHLRLVLVSNSELTSWSNGARSSIDNTLIRDMAQDMLATQFREYVKKNREVLKAIFN